jgi:hypothetical protein
VSFRAFTPWPGSPSRCWRSAQAWLIRLGWIPNPWPAGPSVPVRVAEAEPEAGPPSLVLALPRLDLEAAQARLESILGWPMVLREGLYHGGDYASLDVPSGGSLTLERNWDLLDNQPLTPEVPAECSLLFVHGELLTGVLLRALPEAVVVRNLG